MLADSGWVDGNVATNGFAFEIKKGDNTDKWHNVSVEGYDLLRSNVYEKKPLSAIIKACLLATGLQLDTHIYCNILETTQDTNKSFLEQTLVASETFMKNDTDWENCYDILNKILERFNLTLLQANGVWNIIRWDELRYAANYQIPGFIYDKDFVLTGTIASPAQFLIQPYDATLAGISYPESGYLKRIFRPYKFNKETFI